jgi:hypothetical protein
LRNKDYAGIADDWTYINLPAVVDDPKLAKALGLTLEVPTDPLVRRSSARSRSRRSGRKNSELPGEAEAHGQARLQCAAHGQAGAGGRRLFQGQRHRPYHSMDDLPKNLRKYGASDHAVTEKQKNDAR